ncbi:hypothetical protein ASE92_17210 [Pedobacter sp. Leaf41]|nr:hypothetical protein ASE92_17210 [Pedobacter sp. Leaf41]
MVIAKTISIPLNLESLTNAFMVNKLNAKIWIVFLFCVRVCYAQNGLSDSVNKLIIPIDSNQSGGYTYPTDFLFKTLDGNKVYAIGEATHGTRNFIDFRFSLIKTLVLEHNYKVIVTETDFSSTLMLNDYIVNGNGSPKDALKLIGYWMYNNSDFLNVVEWLKTYNDSKGPGDKVHFYGCDMTAPAIIGSVIRGEYRFKNAALNDEMLGALKQLRVPTSKSFTKDEGDLFNGIGVKIDQEIASQPTNSVSRISLNSILQLIKYRALGPGKLRAELRDKMMYENINSIMALQPNAKVIFLAHNMHISKKLMLAGQQPVGQLLSKSLGKKYYALGLLFYEGEFLANDRINSGFKVFNVKQDDPVFFEQRIISSKNDAYLDFNTLPYDRAIINFLSKKVKTRQVGATFSNSKADLENTSIETRPSESFDGVVIFKKTYPIKQPFKWND